MFLSEQNDSNDIRWRKHFKRLTKCVAAFIQNFASFIVTTIVTNKSSKTYMKFHKSIENLTDDFDRTGQRFGRARVLIIIILCED